ncbi:MAG TPA: PEGA domain-containing protein [Bacteroidota bacterium]|nr:PEGA domain-containing protein [Bacteroidota bacterium]
MKRHANAAHMRILLPVCVLMLAAPVRTLAQASTDTMATSTAALKIDSDQPGAIVWLDGDSVGVTPLALNSVQPGKHHLRLLAPDLTNWLNDPVDDTIEVVAASVRNFRYELPSRTLVLTSPPEAQVFVNDTLVGTTPIVLNKPPSRFTLRRPGYADTTLDGTQTGRGIVSVRLQRTWTQSEEASIFKDSEERTSPLRLYLTGATTVIAGAVSAYYKVKADNLYSRYAQTGDPAQLAEVNRLDTAAGVALAVTQVSLGLFTYFLLSE